MSKSSAGIMDALKQSTARQHHDAEHRQLQRQLVAGRLPAPLYAAWLAQMYLLHQALWEAVSQHRASQPALRDIVRDEGLHVSNLRTDLAALGVSPDKAVPVPATASAITAMRHAADADPLALLGYNYVLEGSMNGNRFIAKAIKRSAASPAVSYLDPYGDEQHASWAAYRDRMSAASLTAEHADRIVAAAKELFSSIAQMSDEVMDQGAST